MDCNCNGEHNHKDNGECGCHDSHDHQGVDTIYLTLEDGKELKCQVVGVFELEGREYIALLPENEENVFLYEYEETEEGPELSIIEDDDFDRVAQAYNKMMEEYEGHDK